MLIVEGVKLETVSEEKDLGISEDLKWEKQRSAAANEENKYWV